MSEVCNGNHQVNSSNHHRRVNRLWVEWKIQIEAKEYHILVVDGEKIKLDLLSKASKSMRPPH